MLAAQVDQGTALSSIPELKTEEDFKVFHAEANFGYFRLVAYRGNDVSFIGDIIAKKIAVVEILIHICRNGR